MGAGQGGSPGGAGLVSPVGLSAPRFGPVGVALAALLLGAGGAAATTFQARVNATRIGVDDQVQLTITLAGASPKGEISMPALKGLEVVGGPSVSTQVSFVNGAISQSRSYTFVLRPTAVGQATIGPARVTLADGEHTTAEITIEVVEGSVMPRGRPPADPFEELFRRDPFEEFFGRRAAPAAPPEVFLEAEVSRRQVYVGEPVLVTIFLLTQTAVSGLDLVEAPSFSGFWVEELPRQEEAPDSEPVTRDGRLFQRFPVMRRLLYPARAGTLTVPALTFRLALPRRIGFFVDPGPAASGTITRSTEPLEIVATPIPAAAQEYGGAVGSFRASSRIDRSELQLGEAAQVHLVLEGRGNFKWLERAPPLEVPGAKVYPPQVSDDLRVTPDGVSGRRTWEYVVVPETAGRLEIPALVFPFFDPAAGRVRRAEAAPITLTVRAPMASTAVGPATAPATDALALRADLLASPGHGEPPPHVILGVAAVALAAHTLLLAVPLLARRRRAGREGFKRRSTRAQLADLRRARAGGLSKEGAAALIERVLTEEFGDLERLAEDASDVHRQAREVVREARFVRYAPQLGEYHEKLGELAQRAAALIRRGA